MDHPRTPENGGYSHLDNDIYDDDYDYDVAPTRKQNRERTRYRASQPVGRRRAERSPKRGKVESRDGTFRCRQCNTMVGPPISGGRHRNHCPLCLYSRHVDRSMPGDRAADCRSMMIPAGVFTRRDGEQMLLHVCKGCSVQRRNRIAADDNMVTLMRLPVVHVSDEDYEEDAEATLRSA